MKNAPLPPAIQQHIEKLYARQPIIYEHVPFEFFDEGEEEEPTTPRFSNVPIIIGLQFEARIVRRNPMRMRHTWDDE